MLQGLLDEEDLQLLLGDDTGENLNGIALQADAFDIDLLTASDGYEYIDVLSAAMQQVAVNKYTADGVIVHPNDWFKISRTKDSTGRYILGDPASATETRIWGRRVAVTSAMSEGYFLVGSFQRGAALYIRLDGTIDISDSHSDFFVRNKLAVRAEERVCLATYRPNAFCYGQFVQSPS